MVVHSYAEYGKETYEWTLLFPHHFSGYFQYGDKSVLRKGTIHVGRKVIAAHHASRGLAYLSPICYVSRLNYWVRNETGCFPNVLAAASVFHLFKHSREKIFTSDSDKTSHVVC